MPSLVNHYDDLRCRLQIADVDESILTVAAFEGYERLSSLFSYSITVITEPEDVQDLEVALGRDAAFSVARGGNTELVIHGTVTEVLPDGAYVGDNRASTTVVIEPHLSNLRYSGGYRIFQQMTVEQIIREVVRPEAIQTVFHVYPPLPTHEYTVQADETDLDFIARLAAHEGLHYYFDRTPDTTVVVFTNRRDGFTDLANDADVDFHHDSGAVSGEHVCSIQRAQRVRTGAIEHRDYDFRSPSARLQGRAELDPSTGHARRERRAYAAGFRDMHELAERRAQLRLAQERADAFTLSGTASMLRFFPGKTFTLHGHRDAAFNRKLLLTRVSVAGKVHGLLSLPTSGVGAMVGRTSEELTSFEAVPAEITIHPPHLPKPPSRLESARVVGPTNGDPFVDEYGRIKVQFHWDRDGNHDENSSCWIRMMTPVGSYDEGFWQAHKVGSEVLVDFIDGDIDRPVVIGAVYNSVDTQPYKMPMDVANSTWKTKSVPGGGGFNEITQDNHTGQEKIYIHAQRNMDITVQSAHTESIGASKTSSIGANKSTTIGANQTSTVGANDTTTVGANQTHSAGVNQSFSAGADQSHSAGANQSLSSGADQSLSAGANQSISVTANQSINVTGNREKTIAGNETAKVLGAHTQNVTGNIDITSSGDITLSGKQVNINADTVLNLTCHGTSIQVSPTAVSIWASAQVAVDVAGVQIFFLTGGNATFQCGTIKIDATGGDLNTSASGTANISAGQVANISAPAVNLNP
ncbi:type VI secretion system tip protein VgrG [Pendulispora brunnea]|uniref:Type VI secretion system tip protein VgrG n=1 Tax=Pendulispora brunnea TaxID=2905690 RepID=A0ABZ2K703_9BACT